MADSYAESLHIFFASFFFLFFSFFLLIPLRVSFLSTTYETLSISYGSMSEEILPFSVERGENSTNKYWEGGRIRNGM